MRSQFLLIPIALCAAAPCPAANYMTVEQAQAAMFPDATFTPSFVKLDDRQADRIIVDARANVLNRDIKAWKVSTGGWFILDQVLGRDDWISYAVGITAQGKIKQIEILECLDKYDGITRPEWRAQFYGKHHGSNLTEIDSISGSTLSSSQMTAGVRRILSTYALVLEPAPSG